MLQRNRRLQIVPVVSAKSLKPLSTPLNALGSAEALSDTGLLFKARAQLEDATWALAYTVK